MRVLPRLMGDIVLGQQDWLLAVGMIVLAIAVLVAWSYRLRGSNGSGWRMLVATLKVLAVLTLGFCLLDPMRRIQRPRPGANIMAVVVDNSRSMQIAPPSESTSRQQRLAPLLPVEASWQTRLAQDFDLRRYAVDERIRAVDDLATLQFDGNASSLATAIQTLIERFANRPVAGLLLLSDGLATDDIGGLLARNQFPFPIYPVFDPTRRSVRDARIARASVQLSSFELAPVGVDAWVEAVGLEGEKLAVRLMDENGQTLEKQTLKCEADPFQQHVRFSVQPPKPGFQVMRVRVALEQEDQDDLEIKSRREVTVANNQRLVAVDRGRGPYRVLYVAGRPNWEFKFLRRALEEDVELRLSALIRIARKEPKFSFRDRGVQRVNPLRAGFDDDDDTAEQYDEPVLLRIGVEEDELVAGMPGTKEELYRYHAIILDDVEAAFFSPQQLLLMRQFVADRGGGLMMLGGVESFTSGGYKGTPLEDVLPVYLRKGRADSSEPVRYQLTREGKLEPWLRLRANQQEEQQRVAQMPNFFTWHPLAGVKPGAMTMARLATSDGEYPGLVVQRFGRGRSIALLVGDFWRWSMRRADPENDDLAQSWRQIVRWLTTDVPRRVEVEITPPQDPQRPHRIKVTTYDSRFQPMDNATVRIVVTEPDGSQVEARAAPATDEPGVYELDYWCRADGGYRCRVEVDAPDQSVLDPVLTGWTAQPSSQEFSRVVPDYAMLQQLARQSGGRVVPLKDLQSFVENLPSDKVPITETRLEPLWHRPWLLLFAIGCLCAEWGIRRWRGLP